MMITVPEAISDLLFFRDIVVVPGMGAFVKRPVPAKVNVVANHFSMPSCRIEFDSNLREDNDLVANYISEKNEISEEEARNLIMVFVSDCFNSLKNGKKVSLDNIGTLYNDLSGILVFEQSATVNYNADSFGLSDFSLEPVLKTKTKAELKVEIEQRQKDKNTPVTVDEKAVHEYDKVSEKNQKKDEGHGLGWLWVLLGLLFVAGIVYGLRYFKVIDFGAWMHKSSRRYIDIKPGTYMAPSYTVDWDEVLANHKKALDSAEPIKRDGAVTADSTMNVPAANIRIIAGCFDQEENAARLTNSLRSKGYRDAFYELRNNRWFVSFGRYQSEEEATAALREIRANTEYKAWILN